MLKNILIVNHNIDEANGIRSRLASSTTNAVCAYTIEEAMEAFSKMNFCLVVLDASMSASDDHNLLKIMRESKTMPILVLSSHSDHSERIHAFNAGANAYMGKPYTDDECLAQAHALMRNYITLNPQTDLCYTLAFGNELVIEPDTRYVTLQGEELKLTRKEYDLLFWLASNPGRVFTEQFIAMAEKMETITELDDEILNRLIQSVIVGDRIKGGGITEQHIRINYKFIGEIA